ncbi:hypothetical protein CROQUDRAFT_9385, partial [Cronartium quercuum f. sp. fusiforme G11]
SIVFSTPVQQYAQKFMNVLHKFQLTTKLTDENYRAWSQPILEAFMSIDCHNYLLKSNFVASTLMEDLHEKTKFLITTYILKLCDENNEAMSQAALKKGTGLDTTIEYDPHALWNFLKARHYTITEGKLCTVDKALHDYKQQPTDSLSVHVDKFERLIQEFYSFGGEMSDIQSARMLMSATPTVDSNETLTAVIYAVVDPLTRLGLATYLKQMEANLTWMSPVLQQASSSAISEISNRVQNNYKSSHINYHRKCTATQCIGPHKVKDCFAKPGNEQRRAKWIAKKEAQRG